MKWFKVWNSLLTDDDFMSMDLEIIGRWTLLGALTSLHGKNGVLKYRTDKLMSLLKTDNIEKDVKNMPNIVINQDNAKTCVTWKNWRKYQRDTTVYERVKRHRRNALREDKKREDKTTPKSTVKEQGLKAKEVISNYCDSFKALYGINPAITAKDAGIAKRVGSLSLTVPFDFEVLLKRFFESKDKFILDNKHSLNILESQINKLLAMKGDWRDG